MHTKSTWILKLVHPVCRVDECSLSPSLFHTCVCLTTHILTFSVSPYYLIRPMARTDPLQGLKKRVFRVRSDECYWKTDEC